MGMTIDDCIKMLIAKEKCMKRETSGIDTDCNLHNCDNCSLCYEQGNMGEQKMALLFAVDAMRQYQLLQADYEARLKADMVAMLEDLKLDMEAKENYYEQAFKELSNAVHEAAMGGIMFGCGECEEIIQQKINALRGE